MIRYTANQRASRPISTWECNSAGDMFTNRVKEKQLLVVLDDDEVRDDDDDDCLFENSESWM